MAADRKELRGAVQTEDSSGQEGAEAGSDTGEKTDWSLQSNFALVDSDFALVDSRVHQADGQVVLIASS